VVVASVDVWRWQPHPEVWVLIGGLFVLALYAVRVIGPKAVRDGSPVYTARQRNWFLLGLAGLWVASDWPVHDIAEEYLYAGHMVQHILLSLVVPPLFLLATPTWLARLVIGDGWFAGHIVRWLARPVVAGVLFNAVVVLTHWPAVVNATVDSAVLHYGLHVLLFGTALLMWTPVCGPVPELRLSLPGQMVYLFLMSVVPTVPAAWLTFADGVVYEAYDVPDRLWGLSVTSDQQLAGLIMKLGGGMYLWTLIVMLFFKWASRHEAAERAGHLVTEHDVLTWDQVRDELERVPPAPPEPPRRG
jgi:putative membrane protein